MNKFKVGDIVRGTTTDRYPITNTDMKKGKVIKVHRDGLIDIRVLEHANPSECGEVFIYLIDSYFDRITCHPEIVITTDGKTTLARLCNDNEVTKSAEAKCSPDDEFKFEIGARLAFNRLMSGTGCNLDDVKIKADTKVTGSHEYLFRGKRVSDGEWVYGCLLTNIVPSPVVTIISRVGDEIGDDEVDFSTVGLWIGINDSNGRMIFEGDTVRCRAEQRDTDYATYWVHDSNVTIISITDYEGLKAINYAEHLEVVDKTPGGR